MSSSGLCYSHWSDVIYSALNCVTTCNITMPVWWSLMLLWCIIHVDTRFTQNPHQRFFRTRRNLILTFCFISPTLSSRSATFNSHEMQVELWGSVASKCSATARKKVNRQWAKHFPNGDELTPPSNIPFDSSENSPNDSQMPQFSEKISLQLEFMRAKFPTNRTSRLNPWVVLQLGVKFGFFVLAKQCCARLKLVSNHLLLSCPF